MPFRSGRCRKCGQIHENCSAHRRRPAGRSDLPLTPCMKKPMTGQSVCNLHGGATELGLAAGNRRKKEQEVRERAERQVRRFMAREDANPADVILELVRYQAGLVDYWRNAVEEIDEDLDIIWGVTGRKEVAGLISTTEETTWAATPTLAYRLLREAQRDLAEYAALAIRVGIEERTVKLAEQQGAIFAGAQRAILTRMYDSAVGSLRSAGVEDPEVYRRLANEWQTAMALVVPEELRAIARRIENGTATVL